MKGQAIGGRGSRGGRGGGATRTAGIGRAPTKAARLERAGGAAAAATGRVDEDEEEEWAGIQSSPEPEQEGQHSDDDEEDEPAVRAAPPPPVKKQRKPTGGTGKKQKVFVEGKVSRSFRRVPLHRITDSPRLQNDLLALAASVSGDVVKKAQEKVEKAVRDSPSPRSSQR